MYKNKYNAKKTIVDGIKFDSKREAERYLDLKLMERAGFIKDLELQPKFLLQDGFSLNGKTYREISYIADFKYHDLEKDEWVVEDVKSKGTVTQVYKLKKKMFLRQYGSTFKFFENFD